MWNVNLVLYNVDLMLARRRRRWPLINMSGLHGLAD